MPRSDDANEPEKTVEGTSSVPESLDDKRFWNRFAFLYGPFMAKNKRAYNALGAHLRSIIEPDMRVLELACGTGQMTERLATACGTWIATDFSEKMVARLKKRKLPGVTACEVADAADLPYVPGSFDCVLITNALHIMPNPDIALREVHRVLGPGGLLIAPTFVYDDTVSTANFRIIESVGFKTRSTWTSDTFCAYVKKHGFKVASAKVLPGNPASECALVAIAQ